MIDFNETDIVDVKYICRRCLKPTKNKFKYYTQLVTEKKAKILAKQQICQKCKGE